eukprot:TRINITY_DN2592_c0_g1_i2.p1 TRINITY_DN2592_c0_g1~~TRINITY_DN2592_c0_g1_i2.p1  ORF type:complete len:140 (+),score=13.22 TRINITY_DN2592_c0_g1_i2:119-538(+)
MSSDDEYQHGHRSSANKSVGHCQKCGVEIKSGTYLVAMDRIFHERCFNCIQCNRNLDDSPFVNENGRSMCVECHKTYNVPDCHKCRQPIRRGTDYLKALNNKYHSHCFDCEGCGTNLDPSAFYAKNGRAFCQSCNKKYS